MTDTNLDPTKLDPDVEKEVLDEEPRSILLGLISQLRKGMDLHRVTLPTFVLEPRSMCERITDFMSHPELILNTPQKPDPVERFVDVVRFFLSGWHIKPKGVKKPYNPVLGEFFRCSWTLPHDQSTSLYVCEQVSHHPPRSAWFYANPANNVLIHGDICPKSKFLGNSAATIMQGATRIVFMNRPNEEYTMTMPNAYARGILFGTMYMEIGDAASVRCPATDLVAELDFKIKGFFTGTYNGIGGRIRRESTGEVLYNISGKWSEVIHIQKASGVLSSSPKEVLFDAARANILPKAVPSEASQEQFESRRLWSNVTKALTGKNIDLATEEKSLIEENQRVLCKDRAASGATWKPRFFVEKGDDYEFIVKTSSILKQDPRTSTDAIRQAIFSAATNPQHAQFWVVEEADSDCTNDSNLKLSKSPEDKSTVHRSSHLPSPIESPTNMHAVEVEVKTGKPVQNTAPGSPMMISPVTP